MWPGRRGGGAGCSFEAESFAGGVTNLVRENEPNSPNVPPICRNSILQGGVVISFVRMTISNFLEHSSSELNGSLAEKLPEMYGVRWFSNAFTRTRHLSVY